MLTDGIVRPKLTGAAKLADIRAIAGMPLGMRGAMRIRVQVHANSAPSDVNFIAPTDGQKRSGPCKFRAVYAKRERESERERDFGIKGKSKVNTETGSKSEHFYLLCPARTKFSLRKFRKACTSTDRP